MNEITRHQSNQRLARVVTHGGVAYLSGVTATDPSGDIADQTRDVLAKIDAHLASVGSDRSRLLSVQIWLRDIEADFAGMNTVWEAWLPPGAAPARATCEARLASAALRVEILVTAALAG